MLLLFKSARRLENMLDSSPDIYTAIGSKKTEKVKDDCLDLPSSKRCIILCVSSNNVVEIVLVAPFVSTLTPKATIQSRAATVEAADVKNGDGAVSTTGRNNIVVAGLKRNLLDRRAVRAQDGQICLSRHIGDCHVLIARSTAQFKVVTGEDEVHDSVRMRLELNMDRSEGRFGIFLRFKNTDPAILVTNRDQ